MKYLAVIIFLVLCSAACKNDPENTTTIQSKVLPPTLVKVDSIQQNMDGNQITTMGIVMSEKEAKPSFKTGGVIRKTYVKEGDIVKKGQLLAVLVMDEINAQVDQAEAAVQKSQRDLNRVSRLYGDSVATLEQFQNAKTGYEVSSKTLEIAKFNKLYSQITAPFTGKIVKQLMFEGEVVGPGNPIYAIIGTGSQDWEIKVGLIDRDWTRVDINNNVKVWMDAYPGKLFGAKIIKKSSLGGQTSGTFDVTIKLNQTPKDLAVGMTCNVVISPKIDETYRTIPIEALVKSNGQNAEIFTIVDGKAKKVEVRISKLLGDKVAVSAGLENVAIVVTTGAMYLEDGDHVTY